uniref:Rho guanine nucleotide exchange factor 26 n=1 Tax=Lepisosteus oculatus TaxID=7918 RepID=W5M249_LEPOC
MEAGNEVDLSNNNIAPLWKRRSASQNGSRDHGKAKPRPLSYQIDGVLMTDFPVEDPCSFTLTQPAENIPSPGGAVVLKHPPARREWSGASASATCPMASLRCPNARRRWTGGRGAGPLELRAPPRAGGPGPAVSPVTLTSQRDQIVFSSSPGPPPVRKDTAAPSASPSPSASLAAPSCCPPGSPEKEGDRSPVSPPGERQVLHRASSGAAQDSPTSPAVVLSTHSPAALKMGTQQLIPKGLASEVKLAKGHSHSLLEPTKRALRALSLVEMGSGALFGVGDADGGGDPDLESPGTLRRGLRSTSYRRAVVSGIDADAGAPASPLRANHLSQPNLRAVEEDKGIPSGVRGSQKKKGLPTQGTFDSEEEEVLYQNYKEKALHNDSDEDAEPKEQKSDDRIVVQYKPLRSMWSQLTVVKKSGILDRTSQEEKKRQEAIFEVISSEHSYLHSLEILIRMFKNSSELSETMTKTENHHLFSNISDVCEASKKFFKELEDRHQQNIVIDDISDIVEKHAMSTFDPYVTYCSNEVYQQRTLQKLLTKNPSFKEVLSRIESHPDCRNLPMISFLILPMQRVTRLPLLMDTICQKTAKDSAKHESCKKAFLAVSKLVRLCNEGARRMERTEMMYTINSQLEFKIKPFPLVSSSRWMVKRGELTAFVEENGIFSKRTSRQQVYFFLFNDVLIVTRKKSEESYNVIDYALRHEISVGQCESDELNLSPVKTTSGMLYSRQGSTNHIFRLSFCSNHSGETVEMILGAELLNERARWISALGQSGTDRNIADRTKLMQVEITRTYTARQPDELSLQVADVVLVYQKVNDGWYEGERLRDGERGWFLSECVQEITCQATIEKNMQRMDRLLGLETNV